MANDAMILRQARKLRDSLTQGSQIKLETLIYESLAGTTESSPKTRSEVIGQVSGRIPRLKDARTLVESEMARYMTQQGDHGPRQLVGSALVWLENQKGTRLVRNGSNYHLAAHTAPEAAYAAAATANV